MFNNVTLIGYLGSDAESHRTRNNSTLTVLSLATKADLEEPGDGSLFETALREAEEELGLARADVHHLHAEPPAVGEELVLIV